MSRALCLLTEGRLNNAVPLDSLHVLRSDFPSTRESCCCNHPSSFTPPPFLWVEGGGGDLHNIASNASAACCTLGTILAAAPSLQELTSSLGAFSLLASAFSSYEGRKEGKITMRTMRTFILCGTTDVLQPVVLVGGLAAGRPGAAAACT